MKLLLPDIEATEEIVTIDLRFTDKLLLVNSLTMSIKENS